MHFSKVRTLLGGPSGCKKATYELHDTIYRTLVSPSVLLGYRKRRERWAEMGAQKKKVHICSSWLCPLPQLILSRQNSARGNVLVVSWNFHNAKTLCRYNSTFAQICTVCEIRDIQVCVKPAHFLSVQCAWFHHTLLKYLTELSIVNMWCISAHCRSRTLYYVPMCP